MKKVLHLILFIVAKEDSLYIFKIHKPLKIGLIFPSAPMGPLLVYCPMVISMKRSGRPQSKSITP
jgi:hypothetical protein